LQTDGFSRSRLFPAGRFSHLRSQQASARETLYAARPAPARHFHVRLKQSFFEAAPAFLVLCSKRRYLLSTGNTCWQLPLHRCAWLFPMSEAQAGEAASFILIV
jgi:hypothetical protein